MSVRSRAKDAALLLERVHVSWERKGGSTGSPPSDSKSGLAGSMRCVVHRGRVSLCLWWGSLARFTDACCVDPSWRRGSGCMLGFVFLSAQGNESDMFGVLGVGVYRQCWILVWVPLSCAFDVSLLRSGGRAVRPEVKKGAAMSREAEFDSLRCVN